MYTHNVFLWRDEDNTPAKPLSCWTKICPAFVSSVDPDQLASSEANWSGPVPFVIQYVNLYQQSGISNLISWQLEMGLIGWQLEMGVAS